MGLRNIGGIYDMAQIGACEALEPRSALALTAPIAGTVSIVMPALEVIWKARHSCWRPNILEMPGGCARFQCSAGKDACLTDTKAVPIGFENLFETLPVRMRCAEQSTKRRLQRR